MKENTAGNFTKILHANCVSIQNRGILIIGPSGSGKSNLSLKLMGLGGQLVSDDRTVVKRRNQEIFAACPDAIKGQIEARGVGILKVPTVKEIKLSFVVDLGNQTDKRLPIQNTYSMFGVKLRLICNASLDAFPEAVYYLATYGVTQGE